MTFCNACRIIQMKFRTLQLDARASSSVFNKSLGHMACAVLGDIRHEGRPYSEDRLKLFLRVMELDDTVRTAGMKEKGCKTSFKGMNQ